MIFFFTFKRCFEISLVILLTWIRIRDWIWILIRIRHILWIRIQSIRIHIIAEYYITRNSATGIRYYCIPFIPVYRPFYDILLYRWKPYFRVTFLEEKSPLFEDYPLYKIGMGICCPNSIKIHNSTLEYFA